jgi:hypothetical protein
VAKQLTDIGQVVLDHRRPDSQNGNDKQKDYAKQEERKERSANDFLPFERQAPGGDTHVRRQAQRQQHLLEAQIQLDKTK